jgi:hypothetical protein
VRFKGQGKESDEWVAATDARLTPKHIERYEKKLAKKAAQIKEQVSQRFPVYLDTPPCEPQLPWNIYPWEGFHL